MSITQLDTIKSPGGRKLSDFSWWTKSPDEAHQCASASLDAINQRSIGRLRSFLLYASLYANQPLSGFSPGGYTRYLNEQRISLNVTQNAIDALVSKLTKNRATVSFETEDGNYDKKRKAQDMDDWVKGNFYQSKFHDISPGVVLDACIYGTGFMKTFWSDQDKCTRYNRVYPWEIRVDDRASMYGDPPTLFQGKYYDKTRLLEMLNLLKDKLSTEEKELREKIEAGSASEDEWEQLDPQYDKTENQIKVWEGWKPSSREGKRDGGHIIFIRGATISIEKYKHRNYPFSKLHPMQPQMGYWGAGFCERLAGVQREINRLVRDIQSAMHLLAKPHWMIEGNSKVAAQHLNNDIATIIRYSGATPPQVYVPQSMSAEVFNHLQWLYKTAYEITGISQLSAQSQKPAGLYSAVGIRTYLDVETERFTDFSHNIENWTRDVAERSIEVARDNGSAVVSAFTGDGTREIDLSDVDLGKDAVIRVSPTSVLPGTQAGKLSYVSELMDRQIITENTDALELLGWPDTDRWVRGKLAARRVIERNIDAMLKGQAVTPEAADNHVLAAVLVTEAYHRARLDGVKADKLGLLLNYLTSTQALMKPPPAPPAPDMPMPGAPPPVPGGAPPMMAGEPPPPMGPPPGPGGPPPLM